VSFVLLTEVNTREEMAAIVSKLEANGIKCNSPDMHKMIAENFTLGFKIEVAESDLKQAKEILGDT